MASDKWCVADFETTGEKFYRQNGYTKVWLFAICDSNAKILKIGSSIEEFFEYCKKLYGYVIYFHNLKFDGSFILYYLMTNGYEYKNELKVKDEKGFSTLIGEESQFYSIKMNYSKSHQVTFEDSMKLLPFKVEKIAKDFKLPILKEKIDYDDYTIDARRIEYVSHDVCIVAMALKQLKDEGMNRMTDASCSYNTYKAMFSKQSFDEAYPDLGTEFLVNWRKAYRGGRCQVNPYYKGKILHNVKRYDINSMYPWAMRYADLPYSYPIECDKPGHYKFELYDIDIGFKLKSGHMPSLLKKQSINLSDDTYYVNTEGIESIKISSPDLKLVYRNYDVYYIHYKKIYGFLTSNVMFADYVDKYFALKNLNSGAKRIIYKFYLNTPYGKFGSRCQGYKKIPTIVKGFVSFVKSEVKDMQHYYLPVAIAITSWSHVKLDDNIQYTGIDNFVYCDTDSIHTLTSVIPDQIDNKKLGFFKLEAIEETSKYIRQKCYMTQCKDDINNDKDDDEYNPYGLDIKCAGMPEQVKHASIIKYGNRMFDQFKEGFKATGKLMPKQVKGGCILIDSTFQIKKEKINETNA